MNRLALAFALIALFSFHQTVFSQAKTEENFDDKVKGMRKIDGFMPVYWDAKTGRMLMEVSNFNS